MNVITSIQLCTIILIASYVPNIDAIKCWKTADTVTTSNLKTEVGKGAAIPSSGDCTTSDKYCKITKNGIFVKY